MKTLFVRPTNAGVEMSFKLQQIVKSYCEFTRMDIAGSGIGMCMTVDSHLFAYMMGALSGLEQTSGSGVMAISDMKKELQALKELVRQHREVVIEERQ